MSDTSTQNIVMDAKRVMAFLREERKRRGKSQEQFAIKSGTNQNTISRAENLGNCTLETLLKLISCMWSDLESFGKDYDTWEENHD